MKKNLSRCPSVLIIYMNYYSTLEIVRNDHTYFNNINYNNIEILLYIFLFLRECLRLLVVGYCYLFDESF